MKIKFLLLAIFTLLPLTACTGKYALERGRESYMQQDYRQAFLRLYPVAKAGDCDAQYAIAYMYYYGQGTIEDRKKAIYWMGQAAKQGNVKALGALKTIKNQKPSPYNPSTDPKKQPL